MGVRTCAVRIWCGVFARARVCGTTAENRAQFILLCGRFATEIRERDLGATVGAETARVIESRN